MDVEDTVQYLLMRFATVICSSRNPICNSPLVVQYTRNTMVNVCCALGCLNRSTRDKHVRYHQFPSDVQLQKKWLKGKLQFIVSIKLMIIQINRNKTTMNEDHAKHSSVQCSLCSWLCCSLCEEPSLTRLEKATCRIIVRRILQKEPPRATMPSLKDLCRVQLQDQLSKLYQLKLEHVSTKEEYSSQLDMYNQLQNKHTESIQKVNSLEKEVSYFKLISLAEHCPRKIRKEKSKLPMFS